MHQILTDSQRTLQICRAVFSSNLWTIVFELLVDNLLTNSINYFILWQCSLDVNLSVLIGSFLVNIIGIQTFSKSCIFFCFQVPYNKLLTDRACLIRTEECGPLVVFVRNSLRSVCAAYCTAFTLLVKGKINCYSGEISSDFSQLYLKRCRLIIRRCPSVMYLLIPLTWLFMMSLKSTKGLRWTLEK